MRKLSRLEKMLGQFTLPWKSLNCPAQQWLLLSPPEVLLMVHGPNCPQLQKNVWGQRKRWIKKKMSVKPSETLVLLVYAASQGGFRNISVRFSRHLSMSAQPSGWWQCKKLSPFPYVSLLRTVTLGLSAFVTSWLHWKSCKHSISKYWQQPTGNMGWGDCVIYYHQ